MSGSKEFVERFRAVVAARGRRGVLSPFDVIDEWGRVVELVADGYEDNIYEYIDDLSVRDLIEDVLQDESLAGVEQMEWFRAQAGEIDARFRSLVRSEQVSRDLPWWKAHLPACAGAELVADISDLRGDHRGALAAPPGGGGSAAA